MPTLPLNAVLESILFFKGGSMTMKELAAAAGVSAAELKVGLEALEKSLAGRGVRLVEENGRVALGTAPETKSAIEAMRREELEGPVGRAGLETLAVVIYQGPVTRADIEYIRGVNVSSTLRTLLIRGLIERVENPSDKRSFLYQATTELPAYFGVSKLSELPEFEAVKDTIRKVFDERSTETVEEHVG